MALNLSEIAKKKQQTSATSIVVGADAEDDPVVSDGTVEKTDYFSEESETNSSALVAEKAVCEGVVHPSFSGAVPLPWVAKSDEHAIFNLTLEEKYLDAKIFIGSITIRSSFVDRKETMMLL